MANLDVTSAYGVAVVRLQRPETFNALDVTLAADLASAFRRLHDDSSVRVVIITGAGKAFSGGGDLRWVVAHEDGPPAAFRELAAHVHAMIVEIRRLPKPVIAAVNGVAAGGGFSLALACDFRVMSDAAVLRQGYTSNGLSIDAGGTFTLPRLVGLARALEIAAFDMPIDASTALEWGLATRVVPHAELMTAAQEMARALTTRSRSAFAQVKALLNVAFDTPLEAQLEAERSALAAAAAHADGNEGIAAFLEKRRPNFS